MKPQCFVYAMVLTTIILFTVRTNAAPVNLSCKERGRDSAARQVTIDENRQTAFFGADAPSNANFTETNIKWSGTFDGEPNSSEAYKASFILDRVTGVLIVSYAENLDYLSKAEFECTVSSIKF